MKTVKTYFAIGCVIAILGIFFSEICGAFFNGMNQGTACVLCMGMYLCVVVVTCTGIIVSKITSKQNENTSEGKDN